MKVTYTELDPVPRRDPADELDDLIGEAAPADEPFFEDADEVLEAELDAEEAFAVDEILVEEVEVIIGDLDGDVEQAED